MKEKVLELVVWMEREEKGFAIQVQARRDNPKSFALTKKDHYEVLLAVVKAVAMHFDQVSGAAMIMEDGKGDPWKIEP